MNPYKGSADESIGVYHEKVLPRVVAGNFFKFEPERKPVPGLRISRNIHNDSKKKKTLVQFVRGKFLV